MAKFSTLLQDRFRKKEKPKIVELAEKSTEGQLTVFSGMFGEGKLNEREKEELSTLLHSYALDANYDIKEDLTALLAISSEVKAIHNQAALLHGERIKRAQTILKKYRDGAFSAWLITTYGNRQTPYNFLHYFEFHAKMPKLLHPQIEAMPRQAVYTLASREGSFSQKEEVVRNYKGEKKQAMIALIRTLFPLDEKDKRRENVGENSIKSLQRLRTCLEAPQVRLQKEQKIHLLKLLVELKKCVEEIETGSLI